MGRHEWQAPSPNYKDAEGYLFAHRVVKASRQFLSVNPELGKSLPRFHEINAAADHLYKYPGDIKLFEGQPEPKGRHRAE